jgi:predicted outer membrane repeat protein
VKAASTNTAFGGCPTGQAGPATDTVALAATTYTLTGPADEDGNVDGDLDITAGGDLVIDGTSDANEVPTTTINGGGFDRIFDVRPDPGQVSLFIQKVLLQNGHVSGGGAGGAIRVADPDANFGISTSRVQQNDAGGNGGAIAVEGAVTGYIFDVSQTQFAQNNADEEGGAIFIDTPQDSNATVDRSSFIGNSAGMGGAAYIESTGSTGAEPVLQFKNSTLTGNTAGTGGGAVAFDFGLGGTVWFKFSTIANNSTPNPGGGGGVFTNSSDQFVLFQGGTIISNNAAGGLHSNCAGPGDFQSLGYNLDSQNSCGLDQLTDLINTNPRLGMSAINTPGKQTTETMALFTGSPAIDGIPTGAPCSGAGGFDQRLVVRPQATACDIGAFEGSKAAADAEGDTINDDVDNCPLDQNTNQSNNDGDLQGDACDPDDDNDAVLDEADNCPTQAGVVSNAGCPVPAAAPPGANPVTPATPAAPAKKCKKKKKKRAASVAKKCKKKRK